MMPKEKQATSLELSKQLKELGATQDSIFAWYQPPGGLGVFCEYRIHQMSRDAQSTFDDGYAKCPVEICSAFTVAELGEMLPDAALSSHSSLGKYMAWYHDYTNPETLKQEFWGETEADARAKMLIWLVENKLVEEAKEDV